MGADGGSIIKRSELVNDEERVEKDNIEDENINIWTRCALTHEKLSDPLVSDSNGNIYNKIAILKYLLGEIGSPGPQISGIRQIRDVVELHRELDGTRWIDPVTRKDLEREGSSEEFAYIAECGHVSTWSVLSSSSCCPVCATSYSDTVVLNPRSAEAKEHNRKRQAQLTERGLSHSLRPTKKQGGRKRKKADKQGDIYEGNKYGRKSS